MAEAQLRQEVQALQSELRTLRGQVTNGRPTAHKDMSLIFLIPKWGGTAKSMSVTEFFDSIEGSSKLGNWTDVDKIQVATLKLTEAAKVFYSGSVELHSPDITWAEFKKLFQARFRDVHTDQFHFMQLRTARQKGSKLRKNSQTGAVL
jgi:hypothetical protein